MELTTIFFKLIAAFTSRSWIKPQTGHVHSRTATFERQVVELHVRVALPNRFSQIGRPQTVLVAAVA